MAEDIAIPDLYFAKQRPVVSEGTFTVDDDRMPLVPGESQHGNGAVPNIGLLSADRSHSLDCPDAA